MDDAAATPLPPTELSLPMIGAGFQDPSTNTATVVAAYLGKTAMTADQVQDFIRQTYATFADLGLPATPAAPQPEIAKPSPSEIRKSITPDALISFLDGKPYKTLKRHLRTHGLEPLAYRQRYGLPADYPMTCPSYSAERSALAKASGLGSRGTPAEEPSLAA